MPSKCPLALLGLTALTAGCAPSPPDSDAALSKAPDLAQVRHIVPKTPASFTAKAQGFSIWLPAKPTQNQKSSALENGQSMTAFMFQAPSDTVSYMVLAFPTPPGVDVSDAKAQLDTTEKSMMETINAQSPGSNVQKREEIQLGGFAGRELKTSLLKGTANTRVRMFITPKFAYQIIAGGPREEVQKQAAQINRVFDSFRILPQ